MCLKRIELSLWEVHDPLTLTAEIKITECYVDDNNIESATPMIVPKAKVLK